MFGLKLFDFSNDVGIDLGTATVLLYVKGKGIVLKEPSVVAIDTNDKKVRAVGFAAQSMIGRTPGSIVAIRPLRDGVISDYESTEKMLRYFLRQACSKRLFKPRVIICVPSGVTEVEKRAVEEAAITAGAKKAILIEEPIAAAIGAGIDIEKPCGNMVVDIGGGTTDIAVISLGNHVVNSSIKVAGDKFDDAVIRFIRKKYNILIGERTAEELKKEIGCLIPFEEERTCEIRGRNLLTGLPQNVTISSNEMIEALSEPAAEILEAVHAVMEKTPPELVADISLNGIVLTGGGSLLYGMDKVIEKETGIEARVADDAVSCVAIGTGKALEYIDILNANGKGSSRTSSYDRGW